MALKKLGQETQIELATMVAFLEEDEDFLEKILDKAGVGYDGDYERFKLAMAGYWLKGARQYIEDVVDTWFARDEIEPEIDGWEDPPMTVITANKTVRVSDGEVKTTYHKVNGSEHEMVSLPVSRVNPEPTEKEDDPWTINKYKPWVPPYKDSDKIKEQVEEILADVEDMRLHQPGFKGWLAASTTAALGGKAAPDAVLKAVNEALEGLEDLVA